MCCHCESLATKCQKKVRNFLPNLLTNILSFPCIKTAIRWDISASGFNFANSIHLMEKMFIFNNLFILFFFFLTYRNFLTMSKVNTVKLVKLAFSMRSSVLIFWYLHFDFTRHNLKINLNCNDINKGEHVSWMWIY